jgi:hypothetical protein
MLSIQIKNSIFVFAKLVMILIDRSFDLFKNESSVYLIIHFITFDCAENDLIKRRAI